MAVPRGPVDVVEHDPRRRAIDDELTWAMPPAVPAVRSLTVFDMVDAKGWRDFEDGRRMVLLHFYAPTFQK